MKKTFLLTITLLSFHAIAYQGEGLKKIKLREEYNQTIEVIYGANKRMAEVEIEIGLLKTYEDSIYKNEEVLKDSTLQAEVIGGQLALATGGIAAFLMRRPNLHYRIVSAATKLFAIEMGALSASALSGKEWNGFVYEVFMAKRVKMMNKIEQMDQEERDWRLDYLTQRHGELKDQLRSLYAKRDMLNERI